MRVLESIVNGFAIAGNSLMDRLCRENGWSIGERKGKRILLSFEGDSVTPRRDVHIIHGEGESVATFLARCRACYPTHRVPNELMIGLLARNEDLHFGGWHASVGRDGEANFWLCYRALTGGLTPAAFAAICKAFVVEVGQVENTLHGKGLLQATDRHRGVTMTDSKPTMRRPPPAPGSVDEAIEAAWRVGYSGGLDSSLSRED
jgi:hypothetical protein